MSQFKVIVEKHPDGFESYLLAAMDSPCSGAANTPNHVPTGSFSVLTHRALPCPLEVALQSLVGTRNGRAPQFTSSPSSRNNSNVKIPVSCPSLKAIVYA